MANLEGYIYLRLDYLTVDTSVQVTIIPQGNFTRLAEPQPRYCVPYQGLVSHPPTMDQLRKMLTTAATAKNKPDHFRGRVPGCFVAHS